MAPKKFLLPFLALALLTSACYVYNVPPDASAPPPPAPQTTVTVAPEFLFFMPAFAAYFLPNVSVDVFFYGERWYYRSGGHWYWGASYRGPWTWISVHSVPGPVLKIPPSYRDAARDYRKIPYPKWEERGRPKKWKDKWDRED